MQSRYSIVSYLSGTAYESIRALQLELAPITHSRQCLDTWEPHITLGSGILADDEELFLFAHKTQQELRKYPSFSVHLHRFSTYVKANADATGRRSPYVLWTDVIPSDELLQFVSELKMLTDGMKRWYDQPWPYSPHATLAFRDLWEEGFEAGKAFLATKSIDIKTHLTSLSFVRNDEDKDREVLRLCLE